MCDQKLRPKLGTKEALDMKCMSRACIIKYMIIILF